MNRKGGREKLRLFSAVSDKLLSCNDHAPAFVRRQEREASVNPAEAGSKYRGQSGFREPVPQPEVGADFSAFIPALLHLGYTLIREAEGVFVSSNEVDHRVGCFHQDVFPFWLYVRALTQPKGCQLRDRTGAIRRQPCPVRPILFAEVTHFRKVAA